MARVLDREPLHRTAGVDRRRWGLVDAEGAAQLRAALELTARMFASHRSHVRHRA
jgi:hypothetical protein